jgi:hypothetical protein
MLGRKATLLGWLVLASLPLGCGTGPTVEDLSVHSRLKGVAAMYGRYTAQHRGQPPKNQQEFEKFLATVDAKDFANFNASSPAELLVSPRDGKPFIVNYGASADPPSPTNPPAIIAQESPVEGGGTLGVTSVGEVRELDANAGS